MKQASAFILALLYLALTSGLAINIHYCMGKIASVKFESVAETACDNCGKEKMNCCGHIYQLVKVNDEHQGIDNNIVSETPVAIIETFNTLLQGLHSGTKAHTSPAFTPEYSPPDLFTLNCVYRI